MPVKILHKNTIGSFNTAWLAPVVNQYLSFELWDPEKTYDTGTLFYLNCVEMSNGHDFLDQLINQGFKVIVDNLWEVDPGPVPGTLRICCDRWFWYNESLWYRHLGLDQYSPAPCYQYRALMPMNRRREHRDDWITHIRTDDLLWSYVEAGRELPDNCDMSVWDAQRYMNPNWYNQCYASMVVETFVRAGSKYTSTFVTEKTFKPIAFQHPFLIYGNRGTLRQLRAWGFETWNNLWNEDYDDISDHRARRDAVAQLLNDLKPETHSPETQARLAHNRNRFFDSELATQGIIKEILQPMVEYA
jgi:hypothetical protein